MTNTMQGVLWMLGTIVSFSVMAVAGREMASTLDTFEVMLYRSIIGVIIVAAFLTATGAWAQIRTQVAGLHVLRNLAHFTGQNLWFFAVGTVPLAQVFALEFTTPIWVILLSAVFLGERLTNVRILCAVLGFAGVLIVARPGATEISPGLITAALAAIFFATTIIVTKRLTRTETIGGILFWLTSMQLVMGVVAAGYDGDIALPGAREMPFVIAVGLGGLMAHYCFTRALSLAPASVVSPIDFARLPTIAIVAWALYNEAIDPLVFLGAAIIFAGNYINILSEMRLTTKESHKSAT